MTNKIQAGSGPLMTLKGAMTDPAVPASNGPCRLGSICGVAVHNEDAAGLTVMDIGPGLFTLSVAGINAGGNSAVAIGDALFYVDADTPKISKKVAGVFIGYAYEAIGSGLTATIKVFVGPKRG